MATGRLKWDEEGKRLYETGTRKAVVYPMGDSGEYEDGVAWSGITGVTKNPGGAEPNDIYADDIKYLSILSAETLAYTIECLDYPDEFAECNGIHEETPGVFIGQQARKAFGFCYRSIIGNDTKGEKYGYKLHLFYNSKCSPSEQSFSTVNESPETATFSFESNCTAVKIDEDRSTCSIDIDSTQVDAAKLKAFEDILYGTDAQEATPDRYVETTDTVMDSEKTYYEYNSGAGTYSATADTEFDPEKTYYEKIPGTPAVPATAAKLPKPAEVIAFFAPAA